jgi:cell division protein FtsZ
MGRALMGTGRAVGDRRSIDAAQQAINSPLLEDVSIEGATGILINITGGPDLTLFEVNEASSLIQEAAHEEANIIFGSVIDANVKDEVRITVIATGFDKAAAVVHDPYGKRAATGGGRGMSFSGAQVTAPQPQQITLPYGTGAAAPAIATPAATTPTAVVAPPAVEEPQADPIPIEQMAPEDTDRYSVHSVLTTNRAAAAATAAALAQGSGPTVTPPEGVAAVKPSAPPPAQAGAPAPVTAAATRKPAPHPVLDRYPAMKQALAEMDVDDEFDIPTFLRRHSTHPNG